MSPSIVQYGYFISDLAHGDLGMSLYTNRPVLTESPSSCRRRSNW